MERYKEKEILNMYLQGTTLDMDFQLQSQNLMADITNKQLRDEVVSFGKPKIRHYKAEMEVNLLQQDPKEPIDA